MGSQTWLLWGTNCDPSLKEVVPTCDPCAQEVEAGRSEVQGHLLLHPTRLKPVWAIHDVVSNIKKKKKKGRKSWLFELEVKEADSAVEALGASEADSAVEVLGASRG